MGEISELIADNRISLDTYVSKVVSACNEYGGKKLVDISTDKKWQWAPGDLRGGDFYRWQGRFAMLGRVYFQGHASGHFICIPKTKQNCYQGSPVLCLYRAYSLPDYPTPEPRYLWNSVENLRRPYEWYKEHICACRFQKDISTEMRDSIEVWKNKRLADGEVVNEEAQAAAHKASVEAAADEVFLKSISPTPHQLPAKDSDTDTPVTKKTKSSKDGSLPSRSEEALRSLQVKTVFSYHGFFTRHISPEFQECIDNLPRSTQVEKDFVDCVTDALIYKSLSGKLE